MTINIIDATRTTSRTNKTSGLFKSQGVVGTGIIRNQDATFNLTTERVRMAPDHRSWSASGIAGVSGAVVLYDYDTPSGVFGGLGLLENIVVVNRGVVPADIYIDNSEGLARAAAASGKATGYITLASGESIESYGLHSHVGIYDPANGGAAIYMWGNVRFNPDVI